MCLNLQKIRQYITPDGFFITVIKYGGGTLQIVLGILFALAKGDFCECVFETQESELKLKLKKWEYALAGHVVHTTVAMDEFECQLKCMGTNRCKSAINVLPGDCIGQRNSELKNKTR